MTTRVQAAVQSYPDSYVCGVYVQLSRLPIQCDLGAQAKTGIGLHVWCHCPRLRLHLQLLSLRPKVLPPTLYNPY